MQQPHRGPARVGSSWDPAPTPPLPMCRSRLLCRRESSRAFLGMIHSTEQPPSQPAATSDLGGDTTRFSHERHSGCAGWDEPERECCTPPSRCPGTTPAPRGGQEPHVE